MKFNFKQPIYVCNKKIYQTKSFLYKKIWKSNYIEPEQNTENAKTQFKVSICQKRSTP